jgi:hypothetical protein
VVKAETLEAALGEDKTTPATHWFASMLLAAVIAWSNALVVQQITFDHTATHPVVATLDACDLPQGKNPTCDGHWTVAGQTYSSGQLASPWDGWKTGDTLTVLYPANDPSYVRRPGDIVGPGMVLGGIALLLALPATCLGVPRTWRARRRFRAAVRAIASGKEPVSRGAEPSQSGGRETG